MQTKLLEILKYQQYTSKIMNSGVGILEILGPKVSVGLNFNNGWRKVPFDSFTFFLKIGAHTDVSFINLTHFSRY